MDRFHVLVVKVFKSDNAKSIYEELMGKEINAGSRTRWFSKVSMDQKIDEQFDKFVEVIKCICLKGYSCTNSGKLLGMLDNSDKNFKRYTLLIIHLKALTELCMPFKDFTYLYEGNGEEVFFVGKAIEEILHRFPTGKITQESLPKTCNTIRCILSEYNRRCFSNSAMMVPGQMREHGRNDAAEMEMDDLASTDTSDSSEELPIYSRFGSISYSSKPSDQEQTGNNFVPKSRCRIESELIRQLKIARGDNSESEVAVVDDKRLGNPSMSDAKKAVRKRAGKINLEKQVESEINKQLKQQLEKISFSFEDLWKSCTQGAQPMLDYVFERLKIGGDRYEASCLFQAARIYDPKYIISITIAQARSLLRHFNLLPSVTGTMIKILDEELQGYKQAAMKEVIEGKLNDCVSPLN